MLLALAANVCEISQASEVTHHYWDISLDTDEEQYSWQTVGFHKVLIFLVQKQ